MACIHLVKVNQNTYKCRLSKLFNKIHRNCDCPLCKDYKGDKPISMTYIDNNGNSVTYESSEEWMP